mmetsp:Transcript_21595/g.41983  ORF Transcript_21595/g.41983 Transcript_21595/m.41983 type:complete len:271 (+) Transcript_21595:180-992(+)
MMGTMRIDTGCSLLYRRSNSWSAEGDDEEVSMMEEVAARMVSEDPELCLPRRAMVRAAVKAKPSIKINNPEEALACIFALAATSPWTPSKPTLKHVDSMELMSPDRCERDDDDDDDDGTSWMNHRMEANWDHPPGLASFFGDDGAEEPELDCAFDVRPKHVMPSTLPHVDSCELLSQMSNQVGSGWESPRIATAWDSPRHSPHLTPRAVRGGFMVLMGEDSPRPRRDVKGGLLAMALAKKQTGSSFEGGASFEGGVFGGWGREQGPCGNA